LYLKKYDLYIKVFLSVFLLFIMIFLIIKGLDHFINMSEFEEEALILIDQDNPLPINYKTEIISYKNVKISSVLKNNLTLMINNARKDGIYLNIDFAYRNDSLDDYKSGLVVVFLPPDNISYQNKTITWLEENCYKYGFISSYKAKLENDKWYYRFVGEKHSNFMYSNDLTLRKYLLIKKEGI